MKKTILLTTLFITTLSTKSAVGAPPPICAALNSPRTLTITEVYAAPSSGEEEFIELHNTGKKKIDLTEWRVADNSGVSKLLVAKKATIAPGKRIALQKEETKISLNNSSDGVFLYHPDGELIDSMEYENSTKTISWSLIDGIWTTGVPTPGKMNKSVTSSSQTEGENTSTNSDSKITIPPYQTSELVHLSEMIPNPEGPDGRGEWIELYNNDSSLISLTGWIVADAATEFSLDNFEIEPHAYLLLSADETGIALNNTTEDVRLVDPFEKIMDSTSYSGAQEGLAWARIDETWQWTSLPTPGLPNTASPTGDNRDNTGDPGDPDNPTDDPDNPTDQPPTNKGVSTIAEASTLEDNQTVTITGTVLVAPDILGSQYFYIQDETGGAQVYSYKKAFPELTVGDHVEINGTKSTTRGELRIKTSTQEDITVGEIGEPLQPIELFTPEDLKAEDSGTLVSITGTITEKSTTTFHIDDQWTVKMKSGTGLGSGSVAAEDIVTVIAIAVFTDNEWILLPRSVEDIIKQEKTLELIPAAAASPNLGGQPPTIVSEEKSNNQNAIGLAILLTGALAAGGFQWWKKQKNGQAKSTAAPTLKKGSISDNKNSVQQRPPLPPPRVATIFQPPQKP